ncbi:MAG: hypothetical protein EAX86_00155 [Candidatus Heimdallarchaeota archaeon]|nr:hypothetical protein [Candidatus Heimdallarchaeota archaeon]
MSFLISSQRTLERDALSESYYVISDVLGYELSPLRSRVPGLSILKLNSDINPFEVISKIRDYIADTGPLITCLKIVPLEQLIKTDLPLIVETAFELAEEKIKTEHSWKVNLRKRQSNLGTFEVIEAVAERIDWGKVDLSNPDYEIRIEIIRDLTGISVMPPMTEIRMVEWLDQN